MIVSEKIMQKAGASAIVGILLFVSGTLAWGNEDKGSSEVPLVSADSALASAQSFVGIVGDGIATTTGRNGLGNSWPAEIVSSDISHVQPQRMGVLLEWHVGIGSIVRAGQVLGTISAPPTTPEMTEMLAKETSMRNMAQAKARAADVFSETEAERVAAMKSALAGDAGASSEFSFDALERMREESAVQKMALRSFVERAVASHVAEITSHSDWRTIVSTVGLNRQFGSRSQTIQNDYELALLTLVGELKKSGDVPVEISRGYFALATRLAQNTESGEMADEWKAMAPKDEAMFLDLLMAYRKSLAAVSSMETEYKLMISEKSAMAEKDRTMARAEADAADVSYRTMVAAIKGGSSIVAPRSGTISALFKKAGDLVDPAMPIAIISGASGRGLTVRMKIPVNTQQPVVGELVSVIRPGFPNDIKMAKLVGVGTSLDDTGSYMADALLLDRVEWPAGLSVRVLPPESAQSPLVEAFAVKWDSAGVPYVWRVSEFDRIYAQKIVIGRSLGSSYEIYEGLKIGDRYLKNPPAEVREDILLDDLVQRAPRSKGAEETAPVKTGHEGHDM